MEKANVFLFFFTDNPKKNHISWSNSTENESSAGLLI